MTGSSARAGRAAVLAVLLLFMCLVGMNLRAVMGSVPPLVDAMQADLGLGPVAIGLITSAASFGLGVAAPVGQRVVGVIGPYHALTAGLGLVAVGGGLRLVAGSTSALLATAAIAAFGSGLGSIVVPGLIATHLPAVRDLALGLYAAGLTLGMTVTAWLAIPVADGLGGWRPALAVCGASAGVAMLAWAVLARRWRAELEPVPVDAVPVPRGGLPWKSSAARVLTAFCALQMVLLMTGSAWIAPMYVDLGLSPSRSAHLLTAFQATQLAGLLLLPVLTSLFRDRRPVLVGCALLVAAAHVVAIASPLGAPWVYVVLFGLAMGGCSALGLVLVVDMAGSPAQASRLGAMVLFYAFVGGGVGPLVFGLLREVTGGFGVGQAAMVGLSLCLLPVVRGLRPGRTIEPPN